MDGSLFGDVCTLDRLGAAWLKVRGNGGGPGLDGMTTALFEQAVDRHLARLHRQLVRGTYRPDPLKLIRIPKKRGGMRRLAIPTVRDRVVQTAMAQTLTPVLDPEMEDASFAYRPGRGVRQAVARIRMYHKAGYRHVVEADIDDYFDTIPHARLLARLERTVPDPRLLALVADMLTTATEGADIGVPQGSPLSPLLANLYLDDVDEAIEGAGVRLVRFADDFVLLCRTPKRAQAGLRRITDLLAAEGLRLDPEKTRLVDFETGFRFLGHLFVRSIVLESKAPDDLPPSPALGDPAPDDLPPPDPPQPARPLAQASANSAEDAPHQAPSPFRPLYILEKGHRLAVHGAGLAVEGPGDERGRRRAVLTLPPGGAGRVELGPDVDATPEALRLAAADGAEITFTNGHGQPEARLAPPVAEAERHRLHLAQAEAVLNPARRMVLVRSLVAGRLHNQRAQLYRWNRPRKQESIKESARRIGRLIRKLPLADNVEAAMGVEGEAAALYWPAMARALPEGWTDGRRRRAPADDPLDGILNFAASLLARDMGVLILRRGLHPGLSPLHAVQDGRPNLALDLMEEFRAPLVEGLAVYLIMNRLLDLAHFAPGEGGAVRLFPEGAKRLIRGYEDWLDRPVVSPETGRRGPWRTLMADQVSRFARAVANGDTYTPYAMDY
ncbi:CRISPR-associated endonuclease Cas1 [Yunchengibacter salinarum]|uniref:CRISPR-associated endonuclease Cas1 n=1 Tax=Yunchengibacter salinarum TaxID=3133399 RepID=UPI0035B68354